MSQSDYDNYSRRRRREEPTNNGGVFLGWTVIGRHFPKGFMAGTGRGKHRIGSLHLASSFTEGNFGLIEADATRW